MDTPLTWNLGERNGGKSSSYVWPVHVRQNPTRSIVSHPNRGSLRFCESGGAAAAAAAAAASAKAFTYELSICRFNS